MVGQHVLDVQQHQHLILDNEDASTGKQLIHYQQLAAMECR
jgi:hypothetical protein